MYCPSGLIGCRSFDYTPRAQSTASFLTTGEYKIWQAWVTFWSRSVGEAKTRSSGRERPRERKKYGFHFTSFARYDQLIPFKNEIMHHSDQAVKYSHIICTLLKLTKG